MSTGIAGVYQTDAMNDLDVIEAQLSHVETDLTTTAERIAWLQVAATVALVRATVAVANGLSDDVASELQGIVEALP